MLFGVKNLRPFVCVVGTGLGVFVCGVDHGSGLSMCMRWAKELKTQVTHSVHGQKVCLVKSYVQLMNKEIRNTLRLQPDSSSFPFYLNHPKSFLQRKHSLNST